MLLSILSHRTTLGALFIAASTHMAAANNDKQDANDVIEAIHCKSYQTDKTLDPVGPGFMEAPLLRVGCAAQTLSSGENMKNRILVKAGHRELGDAIRQLQTALNTYNASAHTENYKNLKVNGIMNKATRKALYDYATEYHIGTVFFDDDAYLPLTTEDSHFFYLREYLSKKDTNQYLAAFQKLMRDVTDLSQQPWSPPQEETPSHDASCDIAQYGRAAKCRELTI